VCSRSSANAVGAAAEAPHTHARDAAKMSMGRVIAQIAIAVGTVFGRAALQAYRQALERGKRDPNLMSSVGGGIMGGKIKMSVEEAQKVLGVTQGAAWEAVVSNYERMYEANSPERSKSHYLQSKVVMARRSLEEAMGQKYDEEEQRRRLAGGDAEEVSEQGGGQGQDAPKPQN